MAPNAEASAAVSLLATNAKQPTSSLFNSMSNFLNQYFASQSSLIVDRIAENRRLQGRMSAMIKKGTLPKGQGFNFSNLIMNKSIASGGAGWVSVITPDGTQNNCTPSPGTLNPSITTKTFSPEQRLIRSHKICFVDASGGYLFDEQVTMYQNQLADEVADTWEDKDTTEYIDAASHKMIANGSYSESSSAFPLTQPTRYLDMDFLNRIYVDLLQDGAGRTANYATVRGAPQIPIMVSSEQLENMISRNASMRLAFEYAEMGKGEDSTLLKSWAADRALGGWLFVVNNRMPRYDFVNGAWVQRSFYDSNLATTIGTEATVGAAYRNAQFELVMPFHPDVVHRMMPAPIGAPGGMTSGDTVNYDGTVVWENIKNADTSSDEYNPLGNQGRYYAPLMAAYKSLNPRFGYAIMVKRCIGLGAQTACYS